MQHDLVAMIDEARSMGLALPKRTKKRAAVIKARNDYVRVRYMVIEEPGALTVSQVLEFASDIGEAVRTALDFDEMGNPKGRLWKADEPADWWPTGLDARAMGKGRIPLRCEKRSQDGTGLRKRGVVVEFAKSPRAAAGAPLPSEIIAHRD